MPFYIFTRTVHAEEQLVGHLELAKRHLLGAAYGASVGAVRGITMTDIDEHLLKQVFLNTDRKYTYIGGMQILSSEKND